MSWNLKMMCQKIRFVFVLIWRIKWLSLISLDGEKKLLKDTATLKSWEIFYQLVGGKSIIW